MGPCAGAARRLERRTRVRWARRFRTNRGAPERVVDQYRFSTDARSGIQERSEPGGRSRAPCAADRAGGYWRRCQSAPAVRRTLAHRSHGPGCQRGVNAGVRILVNGFCGVETAASLRKDVWQGLKPDSFCGIFGTTEVVPFRTSTSSWSFTAACEARLIARMLSWA